MPFGEEPNEIKISLNDALVEYTNRLNFIEGDNVNISGSYDITLDSSNIEVSTNITEYTDELTQDVVGSMLTNTSDIQWIYNDSIPSITALIDQTVLDHTNLLNIGTNTHSQIDTHIANTSNPHSTTVSQLGLGSVENTALSTWAGSSNITTLGTINTGTWSASNIPILYGGTGQTTTNNALNALLPSQTANANKILRTDATNTSWTTLDKSFIGLSNVENTALSTWVGSNNITTLGTISTGTIPTSLLSGSVPTSKGGTNLSTTPSNGQLLIGNGSGFTLAQIQSGINSTVTPSSGNITVSFSTTGKGDYWAESATAPDVNASVTSASRAIAIGDTASVGSGATSSYAIGSSAKVTSGSYSFAIGTSTATSTGTAITQNVTSSYNMIIGNALSTSSGNADIKSTTSSRNIVIGNASTASSTTVGVSAENSNAVVIGNALDTSTTASRFTKGSDYGVAIGTGSQHSTGTTYATSIGTDSRITSGTGVIAIGKLTEGDGNDGSICIGTGSSTIDNIQGIDIGYNAGSVTNNVGGNQNTHLGYNAQSSFDVLNGLGTNTADNVLLCTGVNPPLVGPTDNNKYMLYRLVTSMTAGGTISTQFLIPNDTVWAVNIIAAGRGPLAVNRMGAWTYDCVLKKSGGTTSLIGTETKTLLGRSNTDMNTRIYTSGSNVYFEVSVVALVPVYWQILYEFTEV